MLKKFICGLGLAAALVGTSAVFTSCKDTDEDFRNQTQSEFVKLYGLLDNLNPSVKSLQDQITALDALIKTLQGELDDLTSDDGTAGEDQKRAWSEKQLRELINLLITERTSDFVTLSQVETLIANIKQCNCDTSAYLRKDELTADYVLNLLGIAGQGQALKNLVDNETSLTAIAAKKVQLLQLAEMSDSILGLFGDEGTIAQIKRDIATLVNNVDVIASDLATAKTAITDLETAVGALTTRVDKLEDALYNYKVVIGGDSILLSDLGSKIDEISASILDSVGNVDAKAVQALNDIANLSKYFTKADGTMMTVGEFQDAIAQAQWVASNYDALNNLVRLYNEETISEENLKALNQFLLNNSFGELVEMYTILFPQGVEFGDTPKLDYVSVIKRLIAVEDKAAANENEINQIWQEMNGMNEILGSYANMISQLFANMDEMNGKIDDNANEINMLWQEMAQHAENLGSLTNIVLQNEKDIEDLQNAVAGIYSRLNSMVTGLLLQSTWNPLIGQLNTPLGINSMMLMTYYGDNKANLAQFPADPMVASVEYDMTDEHLEKVNVKWNKLPGEYNPINLDAILVNTNAQGQADLGKLWFTVNPGTVEGVNVNNFALVNSVEQESPVKLTNVTKDDETVLTFGYSRAAGNGNGLYVGQGAVAPSELSNIAVHIEPGLKEALKDAVHNRTAANALHLLKEVYQQVKDVCPAQALRYSYVEEGNTDTTKVYSQYGLAATAVKPLGFGTLYDKHFRTLPEWPNFEIDSSLVDLKLKPFEIGDVELNVQINLGSITIDPVGDVWVEYTYPDHFDADGTADHWATDSINIGGDLQDVINNIQASIDEWINGNGGDQKGINDQIQDAIAAAVDDAFNGPDGLIARIENQVNDMMGDIQGKLFDLVNQINTDYIGKINRIGSYYTRLANRINNLLSNPNHYLQVMMMYHKQGGGLGRLSTNPNQATLFKGAGEAIELWPSSYCFESACPMFKKYVAVTKVTFTKDGVNIVDKPELAAAANQKANHMAEAFGGERSQVALNIADAKEAGTYTYEIAYQGLDYAGHTSTMKYYLKVIRK